MANIQTYLNKIKNAIYGRDVRDSIHDAIDAINTESENTKEIVEDFVGGELDTTLTSTTLPAQGKAVGDAVADLKSQTTLNNLDVGTFSGRGNFQNYGLNLDGTFLTTQRYRVSNDDPMAFAFPITIRASSGFRFGIIPFNNGIAGSWDGWHSDSLFVPTGVNFVIQIARVTERTSEIANVDEFLSAVTITSKTDYLFSEFSNRKNGRIIRDFNSFEHEFGTINADGSNNESEYNKTRKIRSVGTVYLNKGDSIKTLDSKYRCMAICVDVFGTSEHLGSGWVTTAGYLAPFSGYYRLQFGLTNDGVIRDYEVERFSAQIIITSDVLSGDDEIYKYFSDAVPFGRRYAYNGKQLTFNKATYNMVALPDLPTPPSGVAAREASAYYNGVLFKFYANDVVQLINYDTSEVIATITAGTAHANSASFSNEFYESTDEFPLCYVGSDNSENDIYVVRVTRSDATIIRTLRIPVANAGYHASNSAVDIDNHMLWTTGYVNDDFLTPDNNNGVYLCSWNLSALTDNGDNTYTPTLVSKTLLPFIDTTQDEAIYGGDLYVLSSSPYASSNRPTKLYVISLDGKRISNILTEFYEYVHDHECEGLVFVERGNKYIMQIDTVSGKRMELLF